MSEEEDFIHGFCTDCRNRMSDNWMMNNAFANSGLSPSCPICGGVVAIMDSRRAKRDIDKSQRDRGIPVID